MIKLSKIAQMRPSPIRKMFEMALGMENVVHLSLGEPDFSTPINIKEAAIESLTRGETHYTPNAGSPLLKRAIAKHLKVYDKVEYDPETEVVVTASGMEALYLTMLAILDPGDEVILADPSYVNYRDQVVMCNAIPKFVQVDQKEGFNFNCENLRKAINSKTKAILMNTPANPTGAVASRELLEKIAQIAIENDLLIIFDEVYKYFLYDDLEFCNIASIPGMKERTIVIDSFSKTYAMTGWRIGYIAGPKEITEKIPKIHENIVSCVAAFMQCAAIEALENSKAAIEQMKKEYLTRRDIIYNGISKIEGLSCLKPQGAFYLFVDIKRLGLSSEEFALRMLREGGVVLLPGSAFGESGEGFVRLSYATSIENIQEGLRRIDQFVQKCTVKGKQASN